MTESEETVPAPVVVAAGGREVSLVWVNEAGGLTFAAGEGTRRCFIKWAPPGSGLDLSGEASRLAWARQYHRVPRPLGHGHDGAGSWLVTAALPGDNAVSTRWKSEPAAAVVAIGEGLRASPGAAGSRWLAVSGDGHPHVTMIRPVFCGKTGSL